MRARNAWSRVAARLVAARPAGPHRSDARLDAVEGFTDTSSPLPQSFNAHALLNSRQWVWG